MKVMTILGTRPEIIRLSRVIPLIDKFSEHIVVHTGQNYDYTLNQIFFEELNIREPNYWLDCKAKNSMSQIGKILEQTDELMETEKPDKILILGDTNSALSSLAAKRRGIKIYHMEAGNRCYNNNVPEEVNRKVIDHCSTISLPYSERSRSNLLEEGIASNTIYVTGNPIKEVLDFYSPQIEQSQILKNLQLEANTFFLVTLHRAENVDCPQRLKNFTTGLNEIAKTYNIPIVWSIHPHTRKNLETGENLHKLIKLIEPVGFFDFVHLEKFSKATLSDSGTVQEECSIFNIPNVTLRNETERPETLECGSNILSGAKPEDIIRSLKIALQKDTPWSPPQEYLVNNVSQKVLKILLGNS